ncbi:MAG: Hpt domain-containing protein [Campylobacterales bacterium]|nr:Hpt domain-containing protein [Campylobacterales bacterium]
MANKENGQKLREIALSTVMELVGDEDTAEIIMDEAVTNLPNLKDELQGALDSSDLELASRSAHSLKGVMSTLGLHSESDYAKVCEQALKSGDTNIEEAKVKLFASIDDFMAV